MQIGQHQDALMIEPLQQQTTLVVLQPAIGPLPVQPFTDRAGDLGDAQSRVIDSSLAHEVQLIGREVTPGKGDGH